MIRLRCRVLGELAVSGALLRVTRWRAALAGWLLAVAVLFWKADDLSTVAGRVTLLRVVAVLLVAGVVNLVDDDAANLLAAVPTRLAWRSGSRLGLAALAVAVPWCGALLWVHPGDPATALTLECAALTAFGLAVAGGVARWSDAREASLAAGPAVLAAAGAAAALPPRWAVFAGPDGAWSDAHLRWTAVLAVAAAVLVGTLRDPAAGSRRSARLLPPGRRPSRRSLRAHTRIPSGADISSPAYSPASTSSPAVRGRRPAHRSPPPQPSHPATPARPGNRRARRCR